MAIDWGNDPAVIPAQDIDRIGEIAMRHRDNLVDELVLSFPDREAYAVAVALALLFTTSMTDDPVQQADQAHILNEVMARWQDNAVPWRLVPAEAPTKR